MPMSIDGASVARGCRFAGSSPRSSGVTWLLAPVAASILPQGSPMRLAMAVATTLLRLPDGME